MNIITTLTNAIEILQTNNLPTNVIKDILYNTYIFDTQYDDNNKNKIIILNENETYQVPDTLPEIEELIDGYIKTLYITSDYGEGIIIYKYINNNSLSFISKDRLIVLLSNAITMLEDCLLNGESLTNTNIAIELGITSNEYDLILNTNTKNLGIANTDIAERRKIDTKQ